jgi:hypothetical protein
VQFQYNSKDNRCLSTSPFKATFGVEPPLGLKSTMVPLNKWHQLHIEQDLVRMLDNVKVNGQPVTNQDELNEEEAEEEEEGNK